MPDKFTATWVSHSSISDYLECPRAYFLKNVYKDPKTGNKLTLMSPSLALGQAVHNVLEGLSVLPANQRITTELLPKFRKEWESVSGKRGGFRDATEERKFKDRGEEMLKRVYENPGPLIRLAVKIQKDLLSYWLSEADEIILCGKIDWLEYLADEDAVHIIDFKTGAARQDESLQLPIYHLLAVNSQKRKVVKASYWYLAGEKDLTPLALPEIIEAHNNVLNIARKVKLARQLQKFDCPAAAGGCRACEPFERIIRGEAELIGQDDFRRDVYILPAKAAAEEVAAEEVIL